MVDEANGASLKPPTYVELRSEGQSTGYADLPSGGTITVEWTASDKAVPEELVWVRVQRSSRKLRMNQSAQVPANSFAIELELGIDPNGPNRPTPKWWSARVRVESA